MGPSAVDVCAKCGREIPSSEQAHVFETKIVCADCDRNLRIASELQSTDLSESEIFPPGSSPTFKDGENIADEDINEILGLDNREVQTTAIGMEGHKTEVSQLKSDEPKREEQGHTAVGYHKSGVSYHDKAAKARRLGIWGIVLLLTLVGSPVALVLCPIAFSLGCVAITGMRRSGNFAGKGKAITGIVIGLIFYIFVVVAGPANAILYDSEFNLFLWLAGVLFILYLTAAIWTGLDASELMKNITKEERNKIGGAIARSPAGWVLACTSLGVIGWWLYMTKRQDYIDFEIQKCARQEYDSKLKTT